MAAFLDLCRQPWGVHGLHPFLDAAALAALMAAGWALLRVVSRSERLREARLEYEKWIFKEIWLRTNYTNKVRREEALQLPPQPSLARALAGAQRYAALALRSFDGSHPSPRAKQLRAHSLLFGRMCAVEHETLAAQISAALTFKCNIERAWWLVESEANVRAAGPGERGPTAWRRGLCQHMAELWLAQIKGLLAPIVARIDSGSDSPFEQRTAP